MNKIIVLALALCLFATTVYAGYVRGYTRKDGTYVQGYNRSEPNDTVRDNYNYKDNTNPYTGETGTNYYRDNKTSEYYDPYYDSSDSYDSDWDW